MTSASRSSPNPRRPPAGPHGPLVFAGLLVVAIVIGSLVLVQETSPDSGRDAAPGAPAITAHEDGQTGIVSTHPLPTALDGGADGARSPSSVPDHVVATPRSLLSALHGRVVNDEGTPLQGVPVMLRQILTKEERRLVSPARREASSDGNGRFEFSGLLPGPWALNGRASDHVFSELKLELTTAEPDREVELVLPRPGRVVGIVYDAEGQPDPKRQVRARLVGGGRSSSAVSITNAQGRFEMKGLWPGAYAFSFRIGHTKVPAQPPGTLTKVGPASGQSVELRVPAPGGLTGQVLFQGAPIPLCRVIFRGEHATASAKTDMDGRYELSIPMADSGHVVAVRDEVAMTPWVPAAIVSGYTQTLNLRFHDVRLTGRVVEATTREPVPNTTVTFEVLSDSDPHSKRFTRRTDKDGRFTAEHLYPATWRLTPSHRRYLEADSTDVVVLEGGSTDIDLTIAAGATLRVIVRDLEGEPMTADLRVYLLPRGSGSSYPIRHNAVIKGTFEFVGQTDGDYGLIVVRVRHPHFRADRAQLEELALARGEVSLVGGETVVLDVQMTRLTFPARPRRASGSAAK